MATLQRIPYEKIENLYASVDKDLVFPFLKKHENLVQLLLEAPEKIRLYFPDSELRLSYVRDIEDATWEFLKIEICIDIEVNEAFNRFQEFQESWWYDKSVSEMLITIRFVK